MSKSGKDCGSVSFDKNVKSFEVTDLIFVFTNKPLLSTVVTASVA
jgi:hypothetical protein